MAEIVNLSDRRRPPAANLFAGATEVVRFDLGRRPVPASGPTHEERIAVLEEELRRLRETNKQLLEVLFEVLVEARALRLRRPSPTPPIA